MTALKTGPRWLRVRKRLRGTDRLYRPLDFSCSLRSAASWVELETPNFLMKISPTKAARYLRVGQGTDAPCGAALPAAVCSPRAGEASPASETLSGLMTSNPNSRAGWGSKMSTEILVMWGITATHKYLWRSSSFSGARHRASAAETGLRTDVPTRRRECCVYFARGIVVFLN